jgi:glutamate/tyrosine decarboxylase-like PLP-dependent enzyme
MIGDDCRLAELLHRAADAHPELEALSLGLSIATFRYLPSGLDTDRDGAEAYLDELNEAVLERLKIGGEMFVTNALVRGHFALRACIVNFRTTEADIAMIPEIVARAGRVIDGDLRPATLRATAAR